MNGLYCRRSVWRILFPLIRPVGVVSLGALVAGCGTTLEDGYKPRTLGSTPEVRKSYYASPFTDQAEAAMRVGGGGDQAPQLTYRRTGEG